MRIFIAGATGVYARHLIPLLLAAGHQVRGLARTPERAEALQTAGVEPVAGDLLDPAIQAALAGHLRGCDAVLHLATAIPSDPRAPGAWDANTALRTTGTRALLDATLAAGVPRYVQQSIVMAYVDGGDRLLDESTPLATPEERPTAPPVVAMEGMVREVPTNRLAWCILRGGAFLGPQTAQDALVDRLRAGREVVPGDGSHWFAPVHVADMATATHLAVERATAGATYNVNAEPERWGDYVDRLAAHLGVPHPQRDPTRSRPANCRADATAIRRDLGWQPTHSLLP